MQLLTNGAKSFLSGPTLYLRGQVLADAASIRAWNPSPFPTSSDLAEEKLKEDVPRNSRRRLYRLIACRHEDDKIAGSVEYGAEDGISCWVSLYADPILGATASDIRAEMLEIIVPWLLHEQEFMVVWIEAEEGDEPLIQTAAKIGMRFAYRLREAKLRNGTRRDLICYEALHPKWLEKLGQPPAAVEGSVDRIVKSPALPAWRAGPDPIPQNAFAVGERLYLRPIEQADAEEIARCSALESEAFHDQGRHIRSAISYWHWNRKITEESSPEWIRFAIVTREDNIVIGANGLIEVDWISSTAETETEIVRPDYRGAGYGTEAKHLLLDYAFEQIGLHMVRSYVWEFNERSAAALLKQGYRSAGRVAWSGVKNAEFIGDRVFDLLASEWRAHRAASR